MKKLDEKSYSNNDYNEYQVAYDCDKNIIQTVRIHDRGNTHYGFLQSQKVGLDASLRSIEFFDGHFFCYMDQMIRGTMLTGANVMKLNTTSGFLESTLEEFAKEFKPIFDENEILKEGLPIHFSALLPYLK